MHAGFINAYAGTPFTPAPAFDVQRFSGQWEYDFDVGWRPWCYTYGKCGTEGATTSCGHWAYLGGTEDSNGGICRGDEPTGSLLWPSPTGISDVSKASSATQVADNCMCLSAEEIGSACVANTCDGAPGHCRDFSHGGDFDNDVEGGCFTDTSRANCYSGDTCADDVSCREVLNPNVAPDADVGTGGLAVTSPTFGSATGSHGAMYGIHYSDACFDIMYGNRFEDTESPFREFGQQSHTEPDYAWCYTKGSCWGSSKTFAITTNHDIPNPSACAGLHWMFLDRRNNRTRGASCNPVSSDQVAHAERVAAQVALRVSSEMAARVTKRDMSLQLASSGSANSSHSKNGTEHVGKEHAMLVTSSAQRMARNSTGDEVVGALDFFLSYLIGKVR